jgi:hypothetical protein
MMMVMVEVMIVKVRLRVVGGGGAALGNTLPHQARYLTKHPRIYQQHHQYQHGCVEPLLHPLHLHYIHLAAFIKLLG